MPIQVCGSIQDLVLSVFQYSDISTQVCSDAALSKDGQSETSPLTGDMLAGAEKEQGSMETKIETDEEENTALQNLGPPPTYDIAKAAMFELDTLLPYRLPSGHIVDMLEGEYLLRK